MTGAARLAARAAAGCVLVAVLPVTIIAVASAAAASWRGWPPGRLYRASAWCLPMVAVWVAGTVLTGRTVASLAQAPWHAIGHADPLAAAVLLTPAATPAGLLAGGWAWSRRRQSMAARSGGRSPAAAVTFDRRQWRRQVRTAAARIAAPGSAPLLTARGAVNVGATIRVRGHPDRPVTRLPASRLRSHQVVIGSTGTGKTTLLLRLWAAFMATCLRRHAAGLDGPPAVFVIDCKGGPDARRIADRFRRVMRAAGARNVAVWPDDARLSLWELPAGKLVTTLVDLIEHGTGGAAFYADVMDAIVALAVEAPAGPPSGTADFLARLDPAWLALAWAGSADRLAVARSAARQVPDIALRFRTLFRRLGPGLDGPGSFTDADAWYCILEGTAEVAVAEAQARALVDLLATWVSAGSQPRQVLLAVDEFSAVSRRVPIWQLFERARSLGLAVQVSAQSWQGLAAREDDRYRIAATAEGGIWLLRTPHPEPVIALAGQQAAVDSSRQLTGRLRWSRAGTSRLQDRMIADPALIRVLDAGQVAYLYRGGVTYTLVKRLITGPAELAARIAPLTGRARDQAAAARPPDRPARRAGEPAAEPGPGPGRTSLPGIGAFLDEAFGPAAGDS